MLNMAQDAPWAKYGGEGEQTPKEEGVMYYYKFAVIG